MKPKFWAPVALLAAGGLGFFLAGSPGANTKVVFMSVGQGDCTAFISHGKAVLVDAGPKVRDYDAGKRIVLPKLREYGVDEVMVILLTHPDGDHVGGTGALLQAFPRAKIAINTSYRHNPQLLADLDRWEQKPEDVHWMSGNEQLQLGEFKFDLWLPDRPDNAPSNDASLFCYVRAGDTGMVLTGDAPEETEIEMQKKRDWHAEIMKAGHHGSRTSTGEFWLQAVQPAMAVISCGKNNTYGHPSKIVLKRLDQFRVNVLRTDQLGDLVFELNGTRLVRSSQPTVAR